MADAGVLDTEDLRARGARLLDGGRNVRDTQPDTGGVGNELLAVRLRVPEAERDVGCLDLAFRVLALRKAEHVPVETNGATDVTRRHRHEVDLLDLHHTSKRRWSMSAFPSGSLNHAC